MAGIVAVSAPMRDHPVGWRAAMRELSYGPIPWGAWSWTFSDGSTWASVALSNGRLVGWAAVTAEVDLLPVVGVYVAEERRGEGLAKLLVSSVLGYCIGQDHLSPGQEVFAQEGLWAAYPEVIEGCGLRHRSWE